MRRTAPWSSPCSVPRLSRLWRSQQEAAFPRPVPKASAKLPGQGRHRVLCVVVVAIININGYDNSYSWRGPHGVPGRRLGFLRATL